MNRKEWEKEQSWSDVVEADMRYCRSRAKSVDEFLYFMEELGYEVKSGVHISVKAGKMKRSRRLDTLDTEFSKEKLEEYFTEEKIIQNRRFTVMDWHSDISRNLIYRRNTMRRCIVYMWCKNIDSAITTPDTRKIWNRCISYRKSICFCVGRTSIAGRMYSMHREPQRKK